jgi:hypothetical protein
MGSERKSISNVGVVVVRSYVVKGCKKMRKRWNEKCDEDEVREKIRKHS